MEFDKYGLKKKPGRPKLKIGGLETLSSNDWDSIHNLDDLPQVHQSFINLTRLHKAKKINKQDRDEHVKYLKTGIDFHSYKNSKRFLLMLEDAHLQKEEQELHQIQEPELCPAVEARYNEHMLKKKQEKELKK